MAFNLGNFLDPVGASFGVWDKKSSPAATPAQSASDADLQARLSAYYNSDPAFVQEYNRVRLNGDPRTAEQWLYDHLQANPDSQQGFLDFQTTGAGSAVPTEQALYQSIYDQYVLPDMARDAERRAEADRILANYGASLDGSRRTIAGIYDGSILNEEYAASQRALNEQTAALETQIASLRGNLDTESQARAAALTTQLAELRAAQDPLNQARLDAARSQATAINVAGETTLDNIRAQQAQRGYVGGSSGDSAAIARALALSRQNAAAQVGTARVTNATDDANISRFGANENRALADYTSGGIRQIGDYSAGEVRNVNDANSQRRLAYFDNDVARRLAALSLPAEAVSQEFNLRNLADDYGQSGARRSLDLLNWFKLGTSAPASSDPYYQNPLSNGGEALGASLIGLGGNIASANNWWATPKTPTASTATSTGGSTINGSAGGGLQATSQY